jgi:hypothetical protein
MWCRTEGGGIDLSLLARESGSSDSKLAAGVGPDLGPQADARREAGRALFQAARDGDAKALRRALEDNKGLIGVGSGDRDNLGVTALGYAALHGRAELVPILTKLGADVNCFRKSAHLVQSSDADARPDAPLLWAAACGHTATVRALLDAGADAAARDWHRWNAVHFALAGGHVDVLRLLRQAAPELFLARTADGLSPAQLRRRLQERGEPERADIAELLIT